MAFVLQHKNEKKVYFLIFEQIALLNIHQVVLKLSFFEEKDNECSQTQAIITHPRFQRTTFMRWSPSTYFFLYILLHLQDLNDTYT